MADRSKQIENDEIAAQLIARHIGRMQQSWVSIRSLDRFHPTAPVGAASWDTFKQIHREMGALIKLWETADDTDQ